MQASASPSAHTLHRPALVAGQFYAGDPQQLRHTVTQYLQAPPPNTCAESSRAQDAPLPRMVMIPHAGHMYCGHIIGATLSQVRLADSVVLLCPNHTGMGQALAVWPGGHWLTPLGSVPVDTALAEELVHSEGGYSADTAAHMREHSLEVLLPFLQCHSPACHIVPISVALNDYPALERAGKVLGQIIMTHRRLGRDISIIVSSDMNHFANQKRTVQKDSLALSQVLNLDAQQLYRVVQEHDISMCGMRPAVVGICASKEQQQCTAHLVQYGTSADITGDQQSVVGYCGIFVK